MSLKRSEQEAVLKQGTNFRVDRAIERQEGSHLVFFGGNLMGRFSSKSDLLIKDFSRT